ncbi:hypothetical protein OGAPHI_002858 [Ogataea philodendri]|uniref:Uncharacterized protein n=1 Tax=Ogataea philodendri TaxID=1378263 RepID=A0A9P8P954_9ASCO|nr:uncharacterized protein OGAPHI_002858 [Ogataea philodendri]KAH3667209.1 hypothetical protein OGAPHI_002858 [Ogataea philodendri]
MSSAPNDITRTISTVTSGTDNESTYFTDANSHLSESIRSGSSKEPLDNVNDESAGKESETSDRLSPQATITGVQENENPDTTVQSVPGGSSPAEARKINEADLADNIENKETPVGGQEQASAVIQEEPKKAFVEPDVPKRGGYQRDESECHEYYFTVCCCSDVDVDSGNIFTTCMTCFVSSVLSLCTSAATKI